MAKVSFDGENKIISVLAGVTSIDALSELYSEWKRWTRTGNNLKFAQAFTPVGGQATNPEATSFTPMYFFLLNGWVIEASATSSVVIQTNLYPDPNTPGLSLDDILATSNISVRLSDSPVIVNETEKVLKYQGVVWIDSNATVSGTEYPFGTSAFPVNNALHAKIVGELYGISNYQLSGTLLLAGVVTLDNFEMHGAAGATIWSNGEPTIINGQIHNCQLSGDLGVNSESLEFVNCSFADGVENLNGIFRQCGFKDIAYVKDDADITMTACYTQRNDNYHSDFSFRDVLTNGASLNSYGYGGRVAIKDSTHADNTVIFGFSGGDIEVYDTCTAGNIRILGIPFTTVDDQSDGMTVDTSATLASQQTLNQLEAELSAALETIDYDGTCHVDAGSLNTGTVFPMGTGGYPVNNLTDALAIMAARGLGNLSLDSDFTIDQAITEVVINASVPSYIATISNVNLIDITFDHVAVAGTFGAGSSGIIIDEGTIEDGVVNLQGFIDRTAFKGEFFVADGKELDINDSLSVIPGSGSPQINFANVATSGRVSIRRFAGGLRYVNMIVADTIVTASYVTGKAHIEDSNTAGEMSVRGLPISAVNDNRLAGNDGMTLDTTGCTADAETLTNLLEVLEYNSMVVIDAGVAGVSGTAYPTGTHRQPVNNIVDALAIAARISTRNFHLYSNVVVNVDIQNVVIDGVGGKEILILQNVNVDNSYFKNLYLAGAASGGSFRAEQCAITQGFSGLNGAFTRCGIVGDFTVAGETPTLFESCFALAYDKTIPKLFMGSIDDLTPYYVNFRGFFGSLEINNISHADQKLTLGMSGGCHLQLNNTNIAGEIEIGGITKDSVIDNSAGAVVTYCDIPASSTEVQQVMALLSILL